jgi:hypothetical protein
MLEYGNTFQHGVRALTTEMVIRADSSRYIYGQSDRILLSISPNPLHDTGYYAICDHSDSSPFLLN